MRQSAGWSQVRENRAQREQRLRRTARRHVGLQYDEGGRPRGQAPSGLIARIQRLLTG